MNERALRPERIRRLTLTGAASLVARRMNKQEGFQNRALVPALVLIERGPSRPTALTPCSNPKAAPHRWIRA